MEIALLEVLEKLTLSNAEIKQYCAFAEVFDLLLGSIDATVRVSHRYRPHKGTRECSEPLSVCFYFDCSSHHDSLVRVDDSRGSSSVAENHIEYCQG